MFITFLTLIEAFVVQAGLIQGPSVGAFPPFMFWAQVQGAFPSQVVYVAGPGPGPTKKRHFRPAAQLVINGRVGVRPTNHFLCTNSISNISVSYTSGRQRGTSGKQ